MFVILTFSLKSFGAYWATLHSAEPFYFPYFVVLLSLILKDFQILFMYGTELRKKILIACLAKIMNWKCLIGVEVEGLCIKHLWRAWSQSLPLWNLIIWVFISFLHWNSESVNKLCFAVAVKIVKAQSVDSDNGVMLF